MHCYIGLSNVHELVCYSGSKFAVGDAIQHGSLCKLLQIPAIT